MQGLFGAVLHQLLSAEAIHASEGIAFILLLLRFLSGLFSGHKGTVRESLPSVNPQRVTAAGIAAWPAFSEGAEAAGSNFNTRENAMRLKSFTLVLFTALMLLCGEARAEAHSVSLTWNSSTDTVAGYYIYRSAGACPSSGTSGFSRITTTAVTGTAYTDSTVAAGAYCYYATSVLNGVESVPSNLVSAVILPAAPTTLSVTGTN